MDVYTVSTVVFALAQPGVTCEASIKVCFGDSMFRNG
jgi:hypothetical protein